MNNKNSLKNIVDTRLSKLTIDENTERNINFKACAKQKRPIKAVFIAAVVCICILVSIPVMAEKVPGLSRLMNLVGQQSGQMLQPVELTSESNGIKMEVLAAMNDDETAIVYLTLQDLQGKGRVDKTVDLYNYSISGANSFTHELIDYNKDTQTATIRMLSSGGRKLDGKKVSVSVDSFLSGKEYFDNIDTNIKLSNLPEKKVQTIPWNMDNVSGGSGDLFGEFKSKGTIQILKMDSETIKLPRIDFVTISNIGFIDGRLHIQTKWTKSIDNHGFFTLESSNGKKINPSNIYLRGIGDKYIEYIFDVKPDQINSYSLKGDFVKNNNYIEGKWQTTFRIKSIDSTKKTASDIDLGGHQVG